MKENNTSALILGVFVFLGLAEQEHPADIVIWPIQFTLAKNDPSELYQGIEVNTNKIRQGKSHLNLPMTRGVNWVKSNGLYRASSVFLRGTKIILI